ncbi:MAG: SLBB domain-containing protein [Candidatus Marinimicrobia bacterium]|nr:SLBB domain-containing protein [Candidatus Neomarinimicrobiota bacterium]
MNKKWIAGSLVILLSIFALLSAQISESDLTQSGKEELAKRGLTLEEVKSRARQAGIDLSNPEVARQQAKSRGIPESKINEWLRLYNVNQTGQTQTPKKITLSESDKEPNKDTTNSQKTKKDEATTTKKTPQKGPKPTPEKKPEPKKLSYFGYKLFNNIPETFRPSSTGPVNEGYIIGPQDVLRLTLWGATEFQYELKVDKEGRIFVPNVGQYTIANMKLKTAREELKKWLSRKYGGLTKSPPTISMDLTLTRLRPIKIFVLGEVDNSGGYTVSSYSTVFNALYSVGGPKTSGSLRNIKVIRNGTVIDTVDFYEYLVKGKGRISEKLQNDDKIFVPVRGKTVKISGKVHRPAIFELKGNERLNDLLEFAGGLTAEAYTKRIQINRIIPFESRKNHGKLRRIRDFNFEEVLQGKKSISLENGDEVKVLSISDILENYVTINGPVYSPGRYELNNSITTIRQLIYKADSLKDEIYWDRADIYRLQKDNSRKLIEINLKKAINGIPEHNIKLKPRDKLRVYSLDEIKDIYNVSITGKVKNPGTYTFMDSMKVKDLLFKAGGLWDKEFRKQVYLKKAELYRLQNDNTRKLIRINLYKALNQDPRHNLDLKPKDKLRIFSIDEIRFVYDVNIMGKVKNPGTYDLLDSMRVKDLLFKAGGLLDEQYRKKVYLERADLVRTLPDGINDTTMSFNLKEAINGKGFGSKLLQPLDKIIVYPNNINKITNKFIDIKGFVKEPGRYNYTSNMTLEDAIVLANGFKEGAFLESVDLYRPIDYNGSSDAPPRYDKLHISLVDNEFENISYSVSDTMQALQEARQFHLQHRDVIRIYKDPDFEAGKTVSITGEVYFPGEYLLVKDNETLYDLVERAGGIRRNAYLGGAQFIRNGNRVLIDFEEMLKEKNDDNKIELFAGDNISIPKKPNTVQVAGNVGLGGYVKFQRNKRLFYYIKNTGGIKDSTENIYLTYPTGRTEKINKFLGKYIQNPKVEDGSRILVTKKPAPKDKEPFDINKVVTQTMALVTNALTILVLANRL